MSWPRYCTRWRPLESSIFLQSISSSRVTSDSGTAFGWLEPARNTSSDTVFSACAPCAHFASRPGGVAAVPDRLRDPVRIDDHDHRAVAEDGVAGEHRDVTQLARHRLHDDFFGVEHAVDHDAEDLVADLRHHDEAVLRIACLGAVHLQELLEMDQRQQLVAQAQHRRILDALDAVLGVALRAHQLDHGKLRDREAVAARLDDQRGDDRQRERNLDGEARAFARHRLHVDRAADLVDVGLAPRPCRRRGRTRWSPPPRSRSRPRR